MKKIHKIKTSFAKALSLLIYIKVVLFHLVLTELQSFACKWTIVLYKLNNLQDIQE